ncbi:MAG TPA: autotransporter domain-containing protein [Kiloniellales bacterium]|nr:autotransporter domain-containing protein [Kiloniellales bacterium]
MRSTVTASPAHIADGVDASTVTVVLFDHANNAVAGLGNGDFAIVVSGSAVCGSVSETGPAGTYTFQVTDIVAETITVSVTAGGVELEEEPSIVFEAGAPHHLGSTVSATSPHRADGLDASTVTVTLIDAQGNAVSGLGNGDLSVSLSGSAMPGSLRETEMPGTYQFELTSAVAETVTVTVTARVAEEGVTLAQRAVVVFEESDVNESQVHDSFVDSTRSFLFHRMDRILTLEPTHHRLSNRLSPWGLALDGRATVNTLEGRFAASLRGLQRWTSDLAALGEPGGKIGRGGGGSPGRSTAGTFDLWAEGQFSLYKSTAANGERRGSFGIVHGGADWCLTEAMLIGVMAQIDWTEETSPAQDSRVSGTGWMVGPYASMRLGGGLQLDLRAAWGRSTNKTRMAIGGAAEPFSGDFGSERWLLRGALSGTWRIASLQVTPEISLAYLNERQDSYEVSDGLDSVAVGAQQLSLGRFSLKPRFAYPILWGDTLLLPYANPQLLWDFKRAGELTLDGEVAAEENLRGATEVGLRVAWKQGAAAGVSVTYDGIGQQDFEAVAFAVGLSFSF